MLLSRQPSSLRLTGCADPDGGVAVVLGAEPSPAHRPLLMLGSVSKSPSSSCQSTVQLYYCYYHYYYHFG